MEAREERGRLSDAGRGRVMSHHHWANSMRRMEAILERALVGRYEQTRIADAAGVVPQNVV
jgi:hypothetical protein